MLRWSVFFATLAVLAGVFWLPSLLIGPGLSDRIVSFSFLGFGVLCLALEFARRDR